MFNVNFDCEVCFRYIYINKSKIKNAREKVSRKEKGGRLQ